MEREPTNRSMATRSIDRQTYAQLPRHSLMICATLVQNPANLGGLCRTCEAFRLEALVLPDLQVTETPAFRNLAASAHHWQPLIACPPSLLLTWLTQQRQQGYTLVALAADREAVPLMEFTFPRRSVLVLGRELTGIPPEVLFICQVNLTIPQFGLVESLNVQTAGAIGVYEYMRQHSPI